MQTSFKQCFQSQNINISEQIYCKGNISKLNIFNINTNDDNNEFKLRYSFPVKYIRNKYDSNCPMIILEFDINSITESKGVSECTQKMYGCLMECFEGTRVDLNEVLHNQNDVSHATMHGIKLKDVKCTHQFKKDALTATQLLEFG